MCFILSVSVISALQVNYFYSDTCPYCQKMKPLIEEISNYYIVNWYEVSNPQSENLYKDYEFSGVPAFVINTDDNREIKFTGANPQRLICELQEMSTKDCVTYSADMCMGESLFLD